MRLEAGITQTALAKKICVTNAALHYWEVGANCHGVNQPPLSRLYEWAGAMGYDVTITLTPREQQ
jgi:transcriptional regulator with XRE-family HTH domain